MIQKNVERLVKTIKSWSDEDKKIAILVVESVRDCFSTEERLVEKRRGWTNPYQRGQFPYNRTNRTNQ